MSGENIPAAPPVCACGVVLQRGEVGACEGCREVERESIDESIPEAPGPSMPTPPVAPSTPMSPVPTAPKRPRGRPRGSKKVALAPANNEVPHVEMPKLTGGPLPPNWPVPVSLLEPARKPEPDQELLDALAGLPDDALDALAGLLGCRDAPVIQDWRVREPQPVEPTGPEPTPGTAPAPTPEEEPDQDLLDALAGLPEEDRAALGPDPVEAHLAWLRRWVRLDEDLRAAQHYAEVSARMLGTRVEALTKRRDRLAQEVERAHRAAWLAGGPKTVLVPGVTSRLREVAEAVRVADPEAAISWAREGAPACVKTVEQLRSREFTALAAKRLELTGELLPGAEVVPAVVRVSVTRGE